MKHIRQLIPLLAVCLASCTSLREENERLRSRVSELKTRLRVVHRESFDRHEYPELSPFAKQGYDWFWEQTITESSGHITAAERQRVKREHGETAVCQWEQGMYAAHAVFWPEHYQGKSAEELGFWDSPGWTESPTTKSTLSSEGAPSDER